MPGIDGCYTSISYYCSVNSTEAQSSTSLYPNIWEIKLSHTEHLRARSGQFCHWLNRIIPILQVRKPRIKEVKLTCLRSQGQVNWSYFCGRRHLNSGLCGSTTHQPRETLRLKTAISSNNPVTKHNWPWPHRTHAQFSAPGSLVGLHKLELISGYLNPIRQSVSLENIMRCIPKVKVKPGFLGSLGWPLPWKLVSM